MKIKPLKPYLIVEAITVATSSEILTLKPKYDSYFIRVLEVNKESKFKIGDKITYRREAEFVNTPEKGKFFFNENFANAVIS